MPDISSELRPSGVTLCLLGEAMLEEVEVHSGSSVWFKGVSILEVSIPSSMVERGADLLRILQFLMSTRFLRSVIVFSTSPKLWAAPESDSSKDGIRPDS